MRNRILQRIYKDAKLNKKASSPIELADLYDKIYETCISNRGNYPGGIAIKTDMFNKYLEKAEEILSDVFENYSDEDIDVAFEKYLSKNPEGYEEVDKKMHELMNEIRENVDKVKDF